MSNTAQPITAADRAAGAALISRVSLGSQAASLLGAALDSGLLAGAVEGGTPHELARTSGLDPTQVELVCVTLEALEMMVHDEGRYRLTPAMRAVVAGDAPQTIGNTLRWGEATSAMLRRVFARADGRTTPTEAERFAVAAGVWGLASSPIALASFDAVDRAMPEVREVWLAGARHMELGCGAGRDLLRVVVSYPDTRVTGVDLDERALEEVRRQAAELGVADRVETRRCDAREVSDGAVFDSVMWSQMFFPAETRAETIAVIKRALRPGGHLVMPLLPSAFAFGHADRGTGAVQLRLAMVLWRSWGLEWFGADAVRRELEAQGFTFVRTVPHQRTPFIQMSFDRKEWQS